MLVVMNADGSAGVAVRAGVGATVPALGTIAWSVLIGGVLISAVGVLLIVLASRRRTGYPAPPSGGWIVPPPRSAETSTPWQPPAPAEPTQRAEGP